MKIINLLPKSKQRESQQEATLHSVWIFCAVSAASFALVFLGLLGTRAYVQQQGAKIDQQTEQIKNFANKQENAQLRNQVKDLNNVINDFQKLTDATPRWSKVLAALVPLVPGTVKIHSFTADLKNKQVEIIGFSPTREAVIDLYNNINRDSKDFLNIDYPLENVSKPENINFHYDFFIKDELLK